MCGMPVGFIRGAVIFVVADQNQRRHPNLFQSPRVIMFLAREHEVQIVFQRRDAGATSDTSQSVGKSAQPLVDNFDDLSRVPVVKMIRPFDQSAL